MPKTGADLVTEAKAAVHTCSVDDAAHRIQRGALVLDVREPAEFDAGSVPGATNVPRGLLEAKIAEVCPDSGRAIVVHCATGGRAALAAQTLGVMGYTDVVSVDAAFADLHKRCT